MIPKEEETEEALNSLLSISFSSRLLFGFEGKDPLFIYFRKLFDRPLHLPTNPSKNRVKILSIYFSLRFLHLER